MKYFFFFLFPLLLFPACKESPEDSGTEKRAGVEQADTRADHFYGVKSGKVVYETESISQRTREEFFFDDWGEKEARYIEIIHLDPRSKAETGTSRKLTLRIDGALYNIQLDKEEGTKTVATPREPHYDLKELQARLGGQQETAYYLNTRNMYMPEEKEDVLGYPCQLVKRNTSKTSHTTLWFWEGIVLKSETTINAGNSSYGSSRMAVAFEPHVEVEASRFALPDNLPPEKIQEIRNLMDR
jgi:hypothetical protein